MPRSARTPLRWVVAVAIVALTGCGSTVSAATSIATATRVTYCTDGGKPQTLDVYQPPGAAAVHPLLIVVHGGSWARGNAALDEQSQLTQHVVVGALEHGFTVASINYRLAPVDRWPAQIVDTRCAVRYLRATAARWHVDPQRFTALGDSAGAHLASLDALSAGQEPQWNNDEYAGESSAMQAVIDCWGLVDLTASGWSRLAAGIGRNVFRVRLGEQSDVLRRASPVTYIHAGAPPFLIIHGASDTLVPPQQSAELQSRLLAVGDAATLLEVAHAGHGLAPTGGDMVPSLDTVAERAVSFLASIVGDATIP